MTRPACRLKLWGIVAACLTAGLPAMAADTTSPQAILDKVAERSGVVEYKHVPEAERKKMFWAPDREVAEAWFKLHAIKGQTFDVP